MSGKNTTVDHLIPRHLFYRNGIGCVDHENVVLMHKGCNKKKGGDMPDIDDVVRACKLHGYNTKKALRRYFLFKHKIYPMVERQIKSGMWQKSD